MHLQLASGDGKVCGRTNHEHLNIKPVTASWRAANSVFPTSVDTVIFDLEIADPVDDIERVNWAREMPERGGLGVHEMDSIVFVLGLATVVKMRSKRQVCLMH